MSEPLSIGCEGLRLAFRGGFALDVPAFEVPAGTTSALLGPSGSGKSTLLHLLGLLEKSDAGRVLLGGRAVTSRDRDARLAMAAVFQRPWLARGTVADNVAYGLRLRGADPAGRRDAVERALGRVGLSGFGDRSAGALSGGEAQRVALARALALEPRVLLLDEPLASADPLLKRRLAREFADILRGESVTTLYVTHDQDEALVVADRIAVMNGGRIVAEGVADDVVGVPSDPWTASFLGVAPALVGTVVSSVDGLVEVDCGGAIIAAVADAAVGSAVSLGVRPEDVLLFEPWSVPLVSSARNRLQAVVAEVTPRGATFQVGVDVGGVRLAASVSRAAVGELGLAPGSPVLAVFKATAVRVAHLSALAVP